MALGVLGVWGVRVVGFFLVGGVGSVGWGCFGFLYSTRLSYRYCTLVEGVSFPLEQIL